MTLVEKKEERHGKDIIVLTIYALEDGSFTFSLQCAIAGIIRAMFPHQIKETYPTPVQAKKAAISTLASWSTQNHTAKEHLTAFGITSCCTQLEFDFDGSKENG